MLNLYCKLKALRAAPDQGVTTVEYTLILVAVVATVSFVIFGFGQQIAGIFTSTCTNLNGGC